MQMLSTDRYVELNSDEGIVTEEISCCKVVLIL